MRITKILPLAAAVLAVALSTTPVSAHEAPIGDGGPFRVELDTTLPEGVEPRLGNGELELHVPAGMEIVAYGADGEEMAKVDADGNMFGNTNSPTWNDAVQMSQTKPTGAPDAQGWVWVQGGGSLQYHDHRIHFMGRGLKGLVEKPGDTVFEFMLPFSFDGTRTEVAGRLVFDPFLDQAKAAELMAIDAEASERDMSTMHGGEDTKSGDTPGMVTGAPTEMAPMSGEVTENGSDGDSNTMLWAVGAGLVVMVAGAAGVLALRKKR